MALLTRRLPWRAGWRVLDVGCGAGRHARALAAAGARPIGLDLSRALLLRAREAAVPLVRADMRRLPVRAASVDLVVNLFTSFGYFARDEEHARVLHGMGECLVDGGWFAMDFLNADTVRRRLVAEEEQVLGTGRAKITRELVEDGRRVVKTITVPDGRRFVERVRLFQPEELETMLVAAGLSVHERLGDYDGGPLLAGAPRTILLARRER
ncbi:MAG TPA: class I SAM-dependent methyltransferase [Gemmatimonadales bacterium]|nr:class I SAM-dependent methyltransferase [Gemmatimonadales bacterium]